MKVLIDSNVILEVILQREEYEVANSLLLFLFHNKHEMFLTTGCFYGMLYTVDKYLRKDMKMVDPERTDTVRSIMAKILSLFNVAGHDKDSLMKGIGDKAFKDLEDSCQHQAAVKAGCDCLVSFNLKDYSTGAEMKALTPQEFLSVYSEKKKG